MVDVTAPTATGINRSLLYVAEFQHRISNEYMKVISFVCREVALSSTPEVKGALLKVIEHLHASAELHYKLRPPLPGELVDFTVDMAELCNLFALAGPAQQGISVHVATSGSAMLDGIRSWYGSLIVAELMTNSLRHACSAGGKRICVGIKTDGSDVVCQISDDGTSAATVVKPGVGSQLIDALADELQGRITRSYTKSGSAVALCFPIKPEQY